ncbi:MAG TPA: 4-hydroxyphenylacetate decarboxylase activase [Patescibacteria group bacterium]|nr:4-hydroxyphenylacetate decarboxylase activase [Patescibacteria group bacterium]
MNTQGAIFDIQSFSVHDGPGCRTSVFLAGCPLQCQWCANPESWTMNKHILFAGKVCKGEKGCRACQSACPSGSITFNSRGEAEIAWEFCRACERFDCVDICPNQALKQCVRNYTADELVAILRRDFSHWGSGGGVTFTGGEPLMQHEFLAEVLKKCRSHQIHQAIETSGYATPAVFLKIFRYIDFAFIDVKHMDSARHKQGTGVNNTVILANIARLKQSDWPGRLVLRQPIIAGYNDSEENARQLIVFMEQNTLYEINLLPFHRLGLTKWNQLGKDYEYGDHGDVTGETMARLQALYLEHHIACYLGDDTPF